MELDTLWTIGAWSLGAALAYPFIIFGLLLAACAFFIALDIIGFTGAGIYFIGKFFYNLILYPFGKGGWRKHENVRNVIVDVFDGNPEDGVHPVDPNYKNCGEWVRQCNKYGKAYKAIEVTEDGEVK